MNTFGQDSQSANAMGAGGGPWKTEPSPASGIAPGPLRGQGGGSGGGSGGDNGDGDKNGGMGEPSWQQFSDVVVHHGKVGINTFTPLEALTVNGNIKLIFTRLSRLPL